MCPSTRAACRVETKVKLGLLFLSVLLPLIVVSCAANSQVSQTLMDQQMELLMAPSPEPKAPKAPVKAAKATENKSPLEFCAVVPEDNLQDMRGTLGVYFFDYSFDIDLVTNPQVSVKTNFAAAVPDGSTQPNLNGSTAIFQDSNVSYIAGPVTGGLMSQVMVTGRDNIVFANTQFNIHLPNAATLTPSVNVLPASSLNGIGVK